MGIERIPSLPDVGYGVTNSGSSRRNLVVNGDMRINQRFPANNSVISSDGSAPQWFMDRWAITAPAGKQLVYNRPMTASGAPVLPGFGHWLQVTASAGDVTAFPAYYAQAIESAKIQEIAGLPVTLSYWAVCGSTFGSTYWNTVFGTLPANPVIGVVQAGTGINEGTFAAFTGSTYPVVTLPQLSTAWQRFTATGVIPTNAQEVKVYFEGNRTATAYDANAWWGITGVQLEVGAQATPFDKIPFDQSLAECQRFYQKTFSYSVQPAQNSGDYTGALSGVCIVSGVVNLPVWVNYKRPMMKAPVATFYNPVAANANWRNTARGADSGPGAIVNVGDSAVTVIDTQIAADGAGQTLAVHMALSADF